MDERFEAREILADQFQKNHYDNIASEIRSGRNSVIRTEHAIEAIVIGIQTGRCDRLRGLADMLNPEKQAGILRGAADDLLRITRNAIDVCEDAERPAMAEDLGSVIFGLEQVSALVEEWRERADNIKADDDYNAARFNVYMQCADHLEAAMNGANYK